MRKRSMESMIKIRDYAEQYYALHGVSPSTTQIAFEINMPRGTVHKYLVDMDERGIISYNGKDITTELTQNSNVDRSNAPLVGSIRCGTPEEERAEIEEYIALPASIFGYGDFYLLRAKGDSMNLAGIDDGDLIVVEKNVQEKAGDIVVALEEDTANTLKRLAYDEDREAYYLHPESSNPVYRDIYPRQMSIQGIARHVIKKL